MNRIEEICLLLEQRIVSSELTISQRITNCELGVKFNKELLEYMFKDTVSFPPDSELVIWLKQTCRESKKEDERNLKRLIEERLCEKEGTDFPYNFWLPGTPYTK